MDSRLVFVSYAHEDMQRVGVLVRLLDRKLRVMSGSVFWDPDLPVGAAISASVQKLLHEAACVVVVWTESSVHSDWVHGECNGALKDGRLVPVRMDPDAQIPPPFNALKHADLLDWTGQETPVFVSVWRAIENLVARGAKAAGEYHRLADVPYEIEDAANASRELRQVAGHFKDINEILLTDSPATRDLREAFKQVADTYTVVTKAVRQFFVTALKPGEIEAKPYVELAYGDLPQTIEAGRGHCGQILVHYRRVGGVRQEILGRLSPDQLKRVDEAFEYLGTADGDAFSRMTGIGNHLQDEARAIVNYLLSEQKEAARERVAATQKLLDPLHQELSHAMTEIHQLGASLGYVDPRPI